MRAWAVDEPGPIDRHPLSLIERPDPEPGPGQVRVRVQACGVCRTDLHLAEGDLAPRRRRVVPGHEIVGTVDAAGPHTTRFDVGDRIGIPWLAAHVRHLPVLPAGRREPLCPTRVHRMGPGGRLRRLRHCRRGLRATYFPRPLRPNRPPRSCAPGSLGTGPSNKPTFPTGGVWAFMDSAPRPT